MDSDQFIQKTIRTFESKFQISFDSNNLIIQALKHRSYLSISKESRLQSNERLEFLGDAILELIVTDFLFHNYRDLPEGDLSKMKAILVSRKVLAIVARKMELGQFILMNPGEENIGGRDRTGTLANIFEAILGAIYLDKGYTSASEFVETYLIKDHSIYIKQIELMNHKSELLELIQSKNMGMPDYSIIEEEGPDHNKIFVVNVTLNDTFLGTGKAAQKKQAEQEAAKNALDKIKKGKINIDRLK